MKVYSLTRPGLTGFLAVAMYFVLVFDSMSMAICLSKGIEYSHYHHVMKNGMQYSDFAAGFHFHHTFDYITAFPTDDRSHIALLVYLWIGFLGFLLTLPCLCVSLHQHVSKWIIPYLLWRLIFTL